MNNAHENRFISLVFGDVSMYNVICVLKYTANS